MLEGSGGGRAKVSEEGLDTAGLSMRKRWGRRKKELSDGDLIAQSKALLDLAALCLVWPCIRVCECGKGRQKKGAQGEGGT